MRFTGNNLLGEYMRLSREDGDKLESDSITNQRELIKDYVSRHDGLKFSGEYVDDGYSGSNFERPAFMKLMEDIKSGKVNCIIVKDFSRFGRNYIETGRYLEKVFPFMGVRFISILDNYDSASEDGGSDGIIVPFKNLINDSYCRDISMKIRSQLNMKRENGKFIGSFATYGYCKDPGDKNHLVIDPFAADIVRRIFDLKLCGCNSQRIAEELNGMGVLPPAEYKRSKGMNYDCGFKAGNNPKWAVVTVNRILTNEIYTGTMVQGLSRKINYRIRRSLPVPKEDWIRVPGTHEPVVSRETFDKVQRLLLMDTRTSPEESGVHLFSGLVVCGDCGQNMVRRRISRGGKTYNYFHCSTYKNGGGCTSHLINADKLEQIVLETVQSQMALLTKAESVLRQIGHISEEQSCIRAVNGQIEEISSEIERYRNLKAQAYVDMLDEVISRDEFKEINGRFSQNLDAAEKTKKELLGQKQRLLANKTYLKPWVENFRKYASIEKLERPVVVELIERICIYGKDSIGIHFFHEDEMKEMMELSDMPGDGRESGVG